MSWLYFQTWIWYLIAFVVGVLLAWVLLVRPQQRRLAAPETGAGSRGAGARRSDGEPAASDEQPGADRAGVGTEAAVGAGVGTAAVGAAALVHDHEKDEKDEKDAAVEEDGVGTVSGDTGSGAAAEERAETGTPAATHDDDRTEQLPAVNPALSTLDTTELPIMPHHDDSSTAEIPIVPAAEDPVDGSTRDGSAADTAVDGSTSATVGTPGTDTEDTGGETTAGRNGAGAATLGAAAAGLTGLAAAGDSKDTRAGETDTSRTAGSGPSGTDGTSTDGTDTPRTESLGDDTTGTGPDPVGPASTGSGPAGTPVATTDVDPSAPAADSVRSPAVRSEETGEAADEPHGTAHDSDSDAAATGTATEDTAHTDMPAAATPATTTPAGETGPSSTDAAGEPAEGEPSGGSSVHPNADADETPTAQGLLAAPAGAADGVTAGRFPASAMPLDGGAAPSDEFRIKGNEDSMLFHTPESPYYGRTIAEVWFRNPEDAEAAGFTSWTRKT